MQHLNILLLEDDDALRALVADELEEESHTVTSVGSGLEAVKAVVSTSYDLAIIDVRMKGISGLEALEKMRESHFDLPCIVITGYASEEDAALAASLGVRGYLHKPFKMSVLLQKVEQVALDLRHRFELEALEQDFIEYMNWSIETLLAKHAEHRQSVELAKALADNWGLSPIQSTQTQFACLAKLLKLDYPAFLSELLALAEEQWDGGGPKGLEGPQIPVEARIISYVTLSTREPATRFDPSLAESAKKIEGKIEQQAFVRRRALIGLGQALLSTGDPKSAKEAFSSVLTETREGPEAVRAYLGLSDVEQSLPTLQKAVEAAQRYGPALSARTDLEVGIRLKDSHPEISRKLLKRTSRSQVNTIEPRLAEIANWLHSDPTPEDALRCVLDPKNRPMIAPHSRWLTPFVARALAAEKLQEEVFEFFRNHQSGLRVSLEKGQLSVRSRVAIARHLDDIGSRNSFLKLLENDSAPEVRQAIQGKAKEESTTHLPELRVLTFGKLEFYVGDRQIESSSWRNLKAQLVLAKILSRNGAVAEDVLLDTFWPDNYEKGKRGLYNAIALYRKLLRPESLEPTNYVLRSGGQIRLNSKRRIWDDLSRFEEVLAYLTQECDFETLVRGGRELSLLNRGPYLDGCYMDWALSKRRELEQRYESYLCNVAEQAVENRLFHEGLEFAQEVCNCDPYHQRAHIVAMKCHTGLGQPEEAIRVFQKLEVRLLNEFQVEPSTEAIKAFHQAKLL